jgi:glucoamylase
LYTDWPALSEVAPQAGRAELERYIVRKQTSPYVVWRMNNKCRAIAPGEGLRLGLLSPAIVHWTANAWASAEDTPTRDSGLGMYTANLATQMLPPESAVEFTFFSPDTNRWQGTNLRVLVR